MRNHNKKMPLEFEPEDENRDFSDLVFIYRTDDFEFKWTFNDSGVNWDAFIMALIKNRKARLIDNRESSLVTEKGITYFNTSKGNYYAENCKIDFRLRNDECIDAFSSARKFMRQQRKRALDDEGIQIRPLQRFS